MQINTSKEFFDVAIVGYGPVSEIMALALARQGRSVVVFERWRERYPLPRAVCIDHEMYRMLSALGMGDALPAVSHAGPVYRWLNAEWKELLAIDWSAESISGGPEVHFVHQPTLEGMFDKAVRACPNVELNLGWEAVALEQNPEQVTLTVRDPDNHGMQRTVRARYLIGADGANSFVRQAIGSDREDRGFQADWLVLDVLPHEGVTLDIPPAAQYCNPARPTTIVPAGIEQGRYFRRWEFMRLPHEKPEDLENEDAAWALLKPWVTPDQATLVRHKIYTFRSLLTNQWRAGRVLLAGDAAHLMPPFMGQGLCAGLRDTWNLAWKLGLVLDGRADATLLDTYQPERRPHVSDVIDLSVYLGRVICIPDAAQAAARDAAFFNGTATPPPPFPQLTGGLLHRDAQGALLGAAGQLAPHGTVRRGQRQGRFDDIVGLGFVLITRNPAALAVLGTAQREVLDALGARCVLVAAEGAAGDALVDLDGKFLPYMQERGIDTMLMRPDFYLYGSVGQVSEVNALIDDLAHDLQRHGVALESAHAA